MPMRSLKIRGPNIPTFVYAKDESEIEDCPKCGGEGTIYRKRKEPEICPECDGLGWIEIIKERRIRLD